MLCAGAFEFGVSRLLGNQHTHVKHKRTLYSLRHTYAHFALMKDRMSVYTLAEQMGTSVKMIEHHYGHITPALKAQEIAGKRHAPRVAVVQANNQKK